MEMPRLTILPALFLAMLAVGASPSAAGRDSVAAGKATVAARKKAGRPAPRCRTHTPARYRRMAASWRAVPRIPGPRWRDGYRDLVLYSVNLGERVRVFPFLADGTLDPQALTEIERVLRDRNTDTTHEVDPRLVKMMYRLADHFESRQIVIISGYRGGGGEREGGYHCRGSAVDLVLSGVELPRLARFARRLGRVGVGFYPNAGYIHLDVRQRSHFWVDRSGPGQRGCPVRVMAESAARWDREWRPEHDEPRRRTDRHGVPLGATEPPEDDEPGPGPVDEEPSS